MKTNWPALRHGYLILASMALASSPVLAQTQAPGGATATAAVISSVAITQASQRAAVRVEGEGRLEVHAGRMQNPDRLVLDFAGARMAVQKTVIPGIAAPVRGVRIGQYRPDVARVVVDLTTATPYQISRDGEAVVIYFETPSTTPVEPVSSATTLTLRQSEKARQEFRYSATSPRLIANRSSKDWKISAPRFAGRRNLFGRIPRRNKRPLSKQCSKQTRRPQRWRHRRQRRPRRERLLLRQRENIPVSRSP